MRLGRIQFKFIQMLLLSSSLPLTILAFITVMFLSEIAVHDAHERLNSSLNTAFTIYSEMEDNLKFVVRDQNRRIYNLMAEDQYDLLRNEYEKVVRNYGFDFFYITNEHGEVLVSIGNPGLEGMNVKRNPLILQALRGEYTVSTEVLKKDELENLNLLEKAKIPGMEKPEGLVLQAVFPIINNNEIIVGTLTAGYLLNNNNKLIIDVIKQNTGFVSSVFLGTRRIASNLPAKGTQYIVGSFLDPEKFNIMVQKGRCSGNITLSGLRYLAGYTPLYNSHKEIVGILGIGIPEDTVFSLRNHLIKIFIAAVIFSIISAFILGYYRGGKITTSIVELRSAIQAITSGNFEHQIQINSRDEIEDLGNYFNNMTSRLKVAIRELIETQKQLVEYERMAAIGRMATVLSHELKNVFAGIGVSGYYLKSKAQKDCPNLVETIQDIEKEILYANSLLENISRYSHPNKIIVGSVNLNAVVEDALTVLTLEELAKTNKVNIVKEIDPSMPSMLGDGVQLKEVVLNLAINAVQAMMNGGTLTVCTKREGLSAKLFLIDTGAGIAVENLNNLFTPYFTTKSKGLGLGLAISKEIVEAHGGTIQVKSELNKGSTFTIVLPIREVPESLLIEGSG